ncbi:MAG: hypothetical protein HYV37_01830 [Candidatus Levyibacteriota bacterium]|nr:MAG: hypothetical protein HYV37_01830 [Candidatus Levybacteria bacterium]
MKVLPTSGRDLRIFLVSFVVALVMNIGGFFKVTSGELFLYWLLNFFLWIILAMVVIRLVVWVFKKVS